MNEAVRLLVDMAVGIIRLAMEHHTITPMDFQRELQKIQARLDAQINDLTRLHRDQWQELQGIK